MHCPAYRSARNLRLLAVFVSAAFLLSHAEEAKTNQAVNPSKNAPPKKTGALFERVLDLNRVQEPELIPDEMRKAFDELMASIRPEIEKAKTPKDKIEVLNKTLLAERDVTYLSNLYWRDATLAACLLRKRGNCLSTSTLYMLAGEALDLPIHMVVIPRHAFARWDDGTVRINIETTNKGTELSDAYYLHRASQPAEEDVEKLGWCKSLSGDEAIAELHATAACHRAGENNFDGALAHWDEALRLAPTRSDYALRRIGLMADMPGKRDEARDRMALIARRKGDPPPTVVTEALMYLAHDAAGEGNHKKERDFLMSAFVEAPKPLQLGVLTELAFCLRALKDYHGAVRYMELAAVIDPEDASTLYNLAILQKNSGNLKGSLATIETALKFNPESWNLQILKAGYSIADGQIEKGMNLYETIEHPRADEEFWEIMQSWFWAQCQERGEFYLQFQHALEAAHSPRIFEWVDQDPDLDFLREDAKFKEMVATHRARLVGKK